MLHENDAAKILYDMCANEHMTPSEIKEGKIELIAECDGLLKVDTCLLYTSCYKKWFHKHILHKQRYVMIA